jgi:hypothetical protein
MGNPLLGPALRRGAFFVAIVRPAPALPGGLLPASASKMLSFPIATGSAAIDILSIKHHYHSVSVWLKETGRLDKGDKYAEDSELPYGDARSTQGGE